MKIRELRIVPTLTVSVGCMVLLAVGLVLYLRWHTSRKIMSDLAGRLVVRNLEVVSQGIEGHLDPVLRQAEYVAGLVEGGVYDLGDRARLGDLLMGSVAATPRSGGMLILDREGLAVRVRRTGQGGRYELSFPDLGRVASFKAGLNEAEGRELGYWGELFYNPQADTTFINYRRPLRKGGRFVGLIAATATIKDLSRLADELDVDGTRYFVLRRTLRQYGETPLIVGVYRAAAEVDAPLRLLHRSGLVGLAVLIVALVGSALLARVIARPIRWVSDGVMKVGELSFSDVEPIPAGWVKKVGDLARSFNGMLGGLRSFETYVPRTLVQRLIKQVGGSEIGSEERELTVMFTDIADFTAMCEGMSATEVADFINDHFTLLAGCVECESGTIDKYIGDALMAFWGAPEPLENSAEMACRAAREIAEEIATENERRVADGNAPVRIRVGIHTGPLVVGNIGAPSRINYTVVGDTVNATQRLESLGKEIAPDDEVTVLISDTTKARLPEEFRTETAGSFPVKGRLEPVSVHRLIT